MRWLTVGLILVALSGSAASGGEFHGRLYTFTEFDPPALIDDVTIFSEIGYTVSSWTFTLSAMFDDDEFEFVAVDAAGPIGAFDLYTIAGFYPDYPLADFYPFWNTVAAFSLGGLNLYAATAISVGYFYDNDWWDFWVSPGDTGIGARLGGWGTFGDVILFAEACFNMDYSGVPSPFFYWAYGFDEFAEEFQGVVRYSDYYGWYDWYLQDSWIVPQTPTCTLPWSRGDILVVGPFACVDVGVWLAANCAEGFERAMFFVENLDIGLEWLELGIFSIDWTVQGKDLRADLALVWADSLCVEPYFGITGALSPTLGGIALEALTLEYEVGPGIVFKAGEKFTDWEWYNYASWEEQWWSGWTSWGGIAPWHENHWDYSWQGIWVDDFDEYLAVEISGDSCCGGRFDAFVYTWFDTEQTGAFMDWAMTVVGLRGGIGSNTTLMLNVFLDQHGLNWLEVGVNFVW